MCSLLFSWFPCILEEKDQTCLGYPNALYVNVSCGVDLWRSVKMSVGDGGKVPTYFFSLWNLVLARKYSQSCKFWQYWSFDPYRGVEIRFYILYTTHKERGWVWTTKSHSIYTHTKIFLAFLACKLSLILLQSSWEVVICLCCLCRVFHMQGFQKSKDHLLGNLKWVLCEDDCNETQVTLPNFSVRQWPICHACLTLSKMAIDRECICIVPGTCVILLFLSNSHVVVLRRIVHIGLMSWHPYKCMC